MALISLNQQNLNIEVRVGILEKYKPNKEIKKIHDTVEKLKQEIKNEVKKITNLDDPTEINKLLSEDKEKQEKFKSYLANEYNKKIIDILLSIDKLNEKICPGYIELKNSQKK